MAQTWDEMMNELRQAFPEIIIPAEQLAECLKEMDTVPVVRCKDCTYASWRDIDGGVWKCKMAMGDEYHDDDFYCAWGEKCEDE